jgi:hypothetical protein
MVRFLIDLVRKATDTPGGWVHYQNLCFRGRDYSYLTHWGLALTARTDLNVDPEKSYTGLWRPTQLGIDFVHERARVPSRIWIYDNERQPEYPPASVAIDIQTALGTKFNYSELMGRDPLTLALAALARRS